MFIPAAEAHDTSYFMSRYIWNFEDDDAVGGSDYDDLSETCSSRSCSNEHDEDVCLLDLSCLGTWGFNRPNHEPDFVDTNGSHRETIW